MATRPIRELPESGQRDMTIAASEGTIDRQNGEAGFTVIEVVAALAILVMALGVLLNVMSNSVRQTGRAEMAAEAGSLARSLLAKVGTELPMRAGEMTGQANGGFRWQIRIDPYGDGTDRREWPVAAFQVVAEVMWRDGLQERSLALTTLRLGPKEPVR